MIRKIKVPLQRYNLLLNRTKKDTLRRILPSKGLAGRYSFAATAENCPSPPVAMNYAKLRQQEITGVSRVDPASGHELSDPGP